MFETCRACLKSLNVVTCPYFQFDNKSLSNVERHIFNSVIPEMDLNIPNQIFFCESCHSSLQSAYKFKTQCLETEKIIKKYLDSKCVINLEDFDLKAVAFEFSDIMKDDIGVIVEEASNENVIKINEPKNPILTELLTSTQFEDFGNELEIKEESAITIVNHEVGNFFSNVEEVVPAKNNVLYPDNDKVYKESVLYALLQNKSPVNLSKNNQQRTNNMNNKTDYSYTSNTNPYPLSHILHNNFHSEIQNNQYHNQNNYFIINNTNLSQISPVIQNIQNQNSIYSRDNHKVQIPEYYDKNSQLPINQARMAHIEKPLVSSNRNLSQINPIFPNIPNNYIYKKRKLGEAETQVINDNSNYSVNDTSKLNHIEIDLTNISSEEIVEIEPVKNNDKLHHLEQSVTQSLQNKSLPILNDIINPQSIDPGPVPLDSDSSKKPENFNDLQVIPHLKKFFVCKLCGKLLSTRFYAFHMKRHKKCDSLSA